MKIGVVILSRYNSSRLPGKALMKLRGKAVLEYIIDRLIQVLPMSDIVLATSDERTDDPIVQFATNIGVTWHRGSLDDVAQRFFDAAKLKHWDYAVRINGDNIFVDVELLTSMITVASSGDFDFVTNVKGRTFPRGMSIEIVRLCYYEALLPSIKETSYYREHVTSFLYEQESDRYFYFYNNKYPHASGIQMALDTMEDFDRTKKIIERFEHMHWRYNMKEILAIWNEIENERTI